MNPADLTKDVQDVQEVSGEPVAGSEMVEYDFARTIGLDWLPFLEFLKGGICDDESASMDAIVGQYLQHRLRSCNPESLEKMSSLEFFVSVGIRPDRAARWADKVEPMWEFDTPERLMHLALHFVTAGERPQFPLAFETMPRRSWFNFSIPGLIVPSVRCLLFEGTPRKMAFTEFVNRMLEESKVDGSKVLYHATEQDFAFNIMQSGPQVGKSKSDFSVFGTFYLNNCFWDALRWAGRRDKPALMVFNYEQDVTQGREITGEEWKLCVTTCRRGNPSEYKGTDPKSQWLSGWQLANPKEVHRRDFVPVPRKCVCPSHDAWQIALRNSQLRQACGSHLLGVVFFSERDPVQR